MELFVLMFCSYISLYYSGRINIFLNRIIQNIIFVKYLDKMRMGFLCNKDQGPAQDRHSDQQHKSNVCIDGQGHDQGQDDHDRRSYQHSDGHHVGHLDIGNICCQPGNQTGS